ncbi:hypothetical protein THIOSC15_3110003 [uncultured Thiomicrorhabdus sp.]
MQTYCKTISLFLVLCMFDGIGWDCDQAMPTLPFCVYLSESIMVCDTTFPKLAIV